MNKIVYTLLFILIIGGSLKANMIIKPIDKNIKIFYTETDISGWNGTVVGIVQSYSSRNDPGKKNLIGSALSKSRATVRLYSPEGIRVGDVLFIINPKNLIVAKISVTTIFKSKSFGHLMVGHGNFRLASRGDRVVQKVEDNNSKYAYIHKARGDYFSNMNEKGKAISEYKKALALDRGNPETHLQLGIMYRRQGLHQFAYREFSEAYKRINRLYDNEDKFLLLKGMVEIRFMEVYQSSLPFRTKEKFRKEAIKYSREAVKVYPESARMHYLMGFLYYKWREPSDKKAREAFLKVIEINPDHIKAYIGLSELYYIHKNMKKASLYAGEALKRDPANVRARNLLKNIEKNGRTVIIK